VEIKTIANRYGMDADRLKKRLECIKRKHDEGKQAYDKFSTQQDYREELDDISGKANKLLHALDQATDMTKRNLDYDDDLAHEIKKYLHLLIERIERTHVSAVPRKPMFHKNRAAILLRAAWTDLTGKPADTSLQRNSFREFIEDACEYMGIDSTGLWVRHRDKL